MPKLDLLLLPLLGGYVFLITFTITKFYHQRIERQRLIFNSLISGFLLSLIGFFIDGVVLQSPCFIGLRSFLGSLLPIQYNGLNYSILFFLVAYPIAKFLNLIIPNKLALTMVVEKWGNQMEQLFWLSLNHKNDSEKLLMLTTTSNKVYVGYINKISEPIGDSHVTLIPNFSGYRNKDSQELIITTDYLDVLEHYIEMEKPELIDEKMGIVISKDDILMVSKFDSDIFDRFNQGSGNSTDDNTYQGSE